MERTLPEGLLEAVKVELKITHDYLAVGLEALVWEAIDVIDDICGASDYSVEGLPRKLVKAYCRYARSNIPELFEKNFQHDILKLQIRNGVKKRG